MLYQLLSLNFVIRERAREQLVSAENQLLGVRMLICLCSARWLVNRPFATGAHKL